MTDRPHPSCSTAWRRPAPRPGMSALVPHRRTRRGGHSPEDATGRCGPEPPHARRHRRDVHLEGRTFGAKLAAASTTRRGACIAEAANIGDIGTASVLARPQRRDVSAIEHDGDAGGIEPDLLERLARGRGYGDNRSSPVHQRHRPGFQEATNLARDSREFNLPLLPMDVMDQQDDGVPGKERSEERDPVFDVDHAVERSRVESHVQRGVNVHGELAAPANHAHAVEPLVPRRRVLPAGIGGKHRHLVACSCPPHGLLEDVDLGATRLRMAEAAPIERQVVRSVDPGGGRWPPSTVADWCSGARIDRPGGEAGRPNPGGAVA